MFKKIYGSQRYWYRIISDSKYEVIAIVPEFYTERIRRIRVYSKLVDLSEYSNRSLISNWNNHDRNVASAYRYYGRDVSRYKGDIAYAVADSLGFRDLAHTASGYDELAQYMRNIDAQDFDLSEFIAAR